MRVYGLNHDPNSFHVPGAMVACDTLVFAYMQPLCCVSISKACQVSAAFHSTSSEDQHQKSTPHN